jgi:hypothetical protein
MGQEHQHIPLQNAELIDTIKGLADNNTIILPWLDYEYFPVFRLWYYFFEQHHLRNLLVLALDDKVYHRLKSLGIHTFRMVRPYQSKRDIWGSRPAIVRDIICSGINVIQTDSDAFWLKNITDEVYNNPNDLVISIAYGIPKEIVKQWGFTLCCGFYFLRSNEKTKAFLNDNEFVALSRQVTSDQAGLNVTLKKKGVTWLSQDTEKNHGYLKQYDMHIEVLSKTIISRSAHEDGDNEIFVYHPALKGHNGYDKAADVILKLRQIGHNNKKLSAFDTMKYRELDYWALQAKRFPKKVYGQLRKLLS